MKSNKEIYKEICKEYFVPLFLKDWWLDAVCVDGEWDVAIEYDNGLKGVLPYYIVKGKLGHRYITMPKMTQYMGPLLFYSNNIKYVNKLSFEKNVLEKLINQLPAYSKFIQNLNYSITNCLPFVWKGYKQSLGYTYVINNLNDFDTIFKNFKGSLRREIRKAEKSLKIEVNNDVDMLYELIKKTYDRQNKILSISKSFIKRIEDACQKNKNSKVFYAIDENGIVHAAIYIVWDEVSAYYLAGGANTKFRTSGAMSLLMWTAIKYASTVTKQFDFEGSMIKPIERFFSSFGAKQVPYIQITKTNSFYIKFKESLNNIIN